MKLAALINAASGSTHHDAEAKLRSWIPEGSTLDACTVFVNGNLSGAIDELVAKPVDALIIWGGDGTLTCALNCTGTNGPPIIALPGGTINLLPKRLYGPDLNCEHILSRALSDGAMQLLHAGEIGDRRFYIAAMIGTLTGLGESREKLRDGNVIEAAQLVADTDALDITTRLRLHSRSRQQNEAVQATAAAIALREDGSEEFDLAVIDPSSHLDLVAIAVNALISGWENAEGIRHIMTKGVEVLDAYDEGIPATLDGEPCTLPSRFEVELVTNAARVIGFKTAT